VHDVWCVGTELGSVSSSWAAACASVCATTGAWAGCERPGSRRASTSSTCAQGSRMHLDVATSAELDSDSGTVPLHLGRRTARHLPEHAAIALAYPRRGGRAVEPRNCV